VKPSLTILLCVDREILIGKYCGHWEEGRLTAESWRRAVCWSSPLPESPSEAREIWLMVTSDLTIHSEGSDLYTYWHLLTILCCCGIQPSCYLITLCCCEIIWSVELTVFYCDGDVVIFVLLLMTCICGLSFESWWQYSIYDDGNRSQLAICVVTLWRVESLSLLHLSDCYCIIVLTVFIVGNDGSYLLYWNAMTMT